MRQMNTQIQLPAGAEGIRSDETHMSRGGISADDEGAI